MSERLIIEALQAAVTDAIEASSMATLAIKPVGYDGPALGVKEYAEFVYIPNNRQNDYWGDERVYRGNFRVILHWGMNRETYQAIGWLDEIAAAFPKSRIIRNGGAAVQIYDSPSQSGVIEQPSDLLFPLTLPYTSFRS